MWTIESPDDDAIINELHVESYHDRVVGIIGASFLEDRLTTRIQEKLRTHQEIVPRLFKGSGPIAAFSTKIDLAYCLGLFGEEIRRNFHVVRTIRNVFAHKASETSFLTQPAIDLSKNLTILDRFRHPDYPDYFAGGMENQDEALISPPLGTLFPTTGRNRYIAAIEILLGYLFLQAKKPRLPEPDF